jgi:FkbM family methyltransferase
MGYYSQFQQDKYLNENVFIGKENGVFLDIGANNGITFSNTYFFEKYKNWNGICVEPTPEVFSRLCQNRNSICINACISECTGKAMFKKVDASDMLNYLVDYDNNKHQTRINCAGKLIEVDCLSLNDLFQQYQLKKIDFCSIDIEVGELEVLKSFDFELYPIDVFTIENIYYGNYIQEFMESVGYRLIQRLGLDEVYKKNL